MITRRNITVELHPYTQKITNALWTCSNCTEESNKDEWFISRLVTTNGFTKAFQCPKCGWNHEWEVP